MQTAAETISVLSLLSRAHKTDNTLSYLGYIRMESNNDQIGMMIGDRYEILEKSEPAVCQMSIKQMS